MRSTARRRRHDPLWTAEFTQRAAIAVGVIGSVFLLVAILPDAPAWPTYTDTSAGFSVKAPPEFEFDEHFQVPNLTRPAKYPIRAFQGGAFGIDCLIICFDQVDSASSAEEVSAGILHAIERRGKNAEERALTVNGMEAKEISMQFSHAKGERLTIRTYLHGGRYFVVVAQFSSFWTSNRAAEFLDSFQVHDR